ncbi:MAG: transposase family protein, partial [Anaerolineaceae bacterium]|nr:transposase family protein [Anaerolineaceae bacterium]
MFETEKMTYKERRKYIQRMWGRYREAGRKEKGRLLNEMEVVTGMHRKALIRILNGRISLKKRVRERGPTYGAKVADAVRVIGRSLDYPCGERLKPNLVLMAKHLANHNEMRIEPATLIKLGQISVSTLKRLLKKIGRSDAKQAFRKSTRPQRNHLRQAYPMRRIPWNIPDPGHFEVDLVVHSGENSSGEYIHTLQMVDVATGWSEIAVVYGRSYRVMKDGFKTILDRLPFLILELHPDNGSEFFNQHLISFWKKEIVDLKLSRSRPYHKNDNRFVEENNHSLVRAYVGHGRLDTLEQLATLRTLYHALWLYHNFFQPVMRTREKVFSDPLRYRRIFDTAKPPFDRLCERITLPADVLAS